MGAPHTLSTACALWASCRALKPLSLTQHIMPFTLCASCALHCTPCTPIQADLRKPQGLVQSQPWYNRAVTTVQSQPCSHNRGTTVQSQPWYKRLLPGGAQASQQEAPRRRPQGTQQEGPGAQAQPSSLKGTVPATKQAASASSASSAAARSGGALQEQQERQEGLELRTLHFVQQQQQHLQQQRLSAEERALQLSYQSKVFVRKHAHTPSHRHTCMNAHLRCIFSAHYNHV